MTSKDYIKFAAVAKGERGEHFNKPYKAMTDWEKGTYDLWHTYTLNLAHVLQTDNTFFDRAEFLAACGVES